MTHDDPGPSPDDRPPPNPTTVDEPLDPAGFNDRLWLEAVLPILQNPPADLHPNPRVQFALDRLQVAACERAVRILSSDLAPTSA